jgi:hypothetical protein
LKLFQNRLDNAIGVCENVVVPEPQYAPALTFKPGRAFSVSLAVGMLTAICLDDQAMPRASEINNEPSNRILPAKPIAAQTAVAKRGPETSFGVSGPLP